MLKRDILKGMWSEINAATIIVAPSQELIQAYWGHEGALIDLYKKYKLPSKLVDMGKQYDEKEAFNQVESAINIYVTQRGLFSITVKKGIENFDFNEVLDILVEKLANEVIAYIPSNYPPAAVDRYLAGCISLDDLKLYTGLSMDKDMANKLGISKNYYSEIKAGKKQISLEILRTIKRKFPLLDISVLI